MSPRCGVDAARAGADGRRAHRPHAAPAQPGRRLRLPGLRLARARPGAPAQPAEFCENGAKAVAEEATRAASDREFFAEHSVDELADTHRLLAGPAGPAHRADGASARAATHYEPITWDDAFELIADQLRRARPARTRRSSTPRAAPATRPRSLYQLFVRSFGTNNLPDCSNMCHESTRLGAGRDDRHRQGQRHPRRLRTRPS